MRKALLLSVLLLAVPALGASAAIVAGPAQETLVEGHTVFAVVQTRKSTAEREEAFAAAVAVLVREVRQSVSASRFPGVLWFNDQYLVSPVRPPGDTYPLSSSYGAGVGFAYACSGSVLAVDAGGADPRSGPEDVFNSTYNESYRITDPNNRAWVVDKWDRPGGGHIWSVAIMNNQAKATALESPGGASCTVLDAPCQGYTVEPEVHDERTPPYHDDGAAEGRTQACTNHMVWGPPDSPGSGDVTGYASPGAHGKHYPCGTSSKCPNLRYNAVLFFFLHDLAVAGANKDHREGSPDATGDVSGCHIRDPDPDFQPDSPPGAKPYPYSSSGYWPCPEDDDDREGNSHPYNPGREWPQGTYDGRNNHGGGAGCQDEQYCHVTRKIDVYYGAGRVPVQRTFVVEDVEGNTAPYHCHEDREVCNQHDYDVWVDNQVPP